MNLTYCASAWGANIVASRPSHLQTNGMVDRFIGLISEIFKQIRFESRLHLESTQRNYFIIYNHNLP